ncbi:MAG: C4-type zinc ribbon domain-containing protein [Actinomycetota bacterium]|nr:C4-type zinc ribbon domain-containing protein [Actinomycetota bacterium]
MPLEVDDPTLARLLELQAQDTAIKRLEERRASLPEAARLREVDAHLAELGADLEIARKQHDEIAREQSRLEGEMGLGDQKIAREEQRLFSGAVSNPKELGALQAEVAMLKRQRAALEDELLEVMVHKDQAAETRDSLETEEKALGEEAEQLRRSVTQQTAEIDAELEAHGAEREAIAAAGFPEELLKLYEQLRSTKNGVGAARLESGTCQGCHTKVPSREAERMRAEHGLQRCDNCRRILVIV